MRRRCPVRRLTDWACPRRIVCAADVLRPEYALAPAILTAVLLALAHHQQQHGIAPQPLWLMALHTSRVIESQATVRCV